MSEVSTDRQCAAVPFRHGEDGAEILLITSRTRQLWIVPKGAIEVTLGASASAAQEAFEEGGVSGRVAAQPFGCYHHARTGLVDAFLLAVDAEHAAWPERDVRQRQWVPAREAATTAEVAGLRPILEAAAVRIARAA